MGLRKKGRKIVISGYFGFDNCGDEAILLSMLRCLRQLAPDLRIVVLSNDPEKTQALYDVKAVNRWKPLAVAWHLLGCRLFLSGGGSLLQDVTSAKSPRYYLGVLRLARLLARKTMIYAQGIGPLSREKNRRLTAKVLSQCDMISVRDALSCQLLKDLGVKKEIWLTCDPVLALSYEDVHQAPAKELLREMGMLDSQGRKTKPLLLVAARCWGDNRHLPQIGRMLDLQARAGWDVLLVPAHFPDDMAAINQIGNAMTERFYCLGQRLTAAQLLSLTACADKVFSMRLHGLIFAMAMGAPMLALSYDPKIDGFMEQAGLSEYCLSLADFDWENADYLLEDLEYLPMTMRQKQEKCRQRLQETAWATAKAAIQMLD
ncbi:MAG: polysaccharide pyruvyl transferase CsaB [Peptococcaceae bacterium]|jgi:polysaccharide pyruvyl transferase CsaB|nr:polysaccharide pyruvyl transferase CsaB [Peptococcaceae bacterium]